MKSLKFFYILLIFFACNKTEEDFSPPPPPALPETLISMDVNGQNRNDLTGNGSYNDECLALQFSQLGVGVTFYLDKMEERTYHFGEGNFNQFVIHFGPLRINSDDLTSEDAGSLIITKIDEEQQLIDGTFEVFFGDISNGKFENLQISNGLICLKNSFTEDGIQQFNSEFFFGFSQSDTSVVLFASHLIFLLNKSEIQQKTEVENLIKSQIQGFQTKGDSTIRYSEKNATGWIEYFDLNEKSKRLEYDLFFKNQTDSLRLSEGILEVFLLKKHL